MPDDPTKESATDEGLKNQTEELHDKHAEDIEDAPDPRKPEDWRNMPKEGGGA